MAFNIPGSAAQNGLSGNRNATNHASQMNKTLGTSEIQFVYEGSKILTPDGTTFSWTASASTFDFDQPFTLSGTKVGRVVVPVLANGDGADLTVTLYPDSSGSPDTSNPLAQTVISAAWLSNLTSLNGLSAAGQLVRVSNGTLLYDDNGTGTWSGPAGSANGAPNSSGIVTSDDYFVLLGGYDPVSNDAVSSVSSTQFLGGAALAAPVPQPPLPLGVFRSACAVTSSSIVVAGGQTSTISGLVSNAWVASWDANTGTVGSWTAQTALPVALSHAGAATWPINDSTDVVYVIGGSTDGLATGAVSTVYYNTVTNGQLGSAWIKGPSLPQPEHFVISTVINGWLIVTGGALSDTSITGNTYYGKINADGSIGAWYIGPSMPTPVWTGVGSGWLFSTTADALVVYGGPTDPAGTVFTSEIQVLPVTAGDGPGQWFVSHVAPLTSAFRVSMFATDLGTYTLVALKVDGTYSWYDFVPVPLLSVPLPASGLTNGATYHVALHQRPSPSAGGINYLQFGTGIGALPSTFSTRAVNSAGAWTPDSSRSILIQVYDQTVSGQMLHAWEDPNAGNQAMTASTFVRDWYGRLLGYAEAIGFSNDALNSNPTFTSGTSPWSATGGTITQSNAQTHGSYPFSGLLTPDGVTAIVFASSEKVPVNEGTWYTADAWLYSPTGYNNVSLSVNWYDSSQSYIRTSSNVIDLPTATWTHVTNRFQAPTTAAYATLVPTEINTPTTSDLLYLSNVTFSSADPGTLASIAQVDYIDANGGPSGVTQLN